MSETFLTSVSHSNFTQSPDLTPLQANMDGLVSTFMEKAMDGYALAGIVSGGFAKGGVKGGLFHLARPFIRIAPPLFSSITKGGALAAGLIAEGAVFHGVPQGLKVFAGGDISLLHLYGAMGLKDGSLHSIVSLAGLKIAGVATASLHPIIQNFAQASAMVVSNHAAAIFEIGDKPREDIVHQLTEAEVTMLHLWVGMRVFHQLAPSLVQREISKNLSIYNVGPIHPLHSKGNEVESFLKYSAPVPIITPPRRVPSVTPPSVLSPIRPAPIIMEGPAPARGPKNPAKSEGEFLEDLLADAPPSIKKWVEEERQELRGNYPLEKTIKNILFELKGKAQNDRTSLSPEERKFLLAVANKINASRWDDGYWLAYSIFLALHDFAGLRRLEQLLDSSYDESYRQLILANLEEYQKASRHLDGKLIRDIWDLGTIFDELKRDFSQYKKSFIEKRGYSYDIGLGIEQTAAALMKLSESYDLVIAIAKGGLYSGAVANLLGLDTRMIEVHAHNRKNPTSKFIDEIKPEDIAGKRILLVDKDTVTGASVKEAVRLLSPYKPSAIGIYFNNDMGICPRITLEYLESLGIATHYPSNVSAPSILPTFYRLHERLNTVLGRLRKVIRQFDEILHSSQNTNLEAAKAVRIRLEQQEKLFFSLNHFLPGMEKVRDHIVMGLESLFLTYQAAQNLGPTYAIERTADIAKHSLPLSLEMAEELAKGRYYEKGLELAKKRKVENPHRPHSHVASFRSAQKALKGKYDFALIVGPEGFAYEPIFLDLGIKTIAVNIPEADFGGKRSITFFDDLTQIRGKRVLVIEDDVQSGATLRKLVEELKPYAPKNLGLYLGIPAGRQMTENIPHDFKKVYMTEIDENLDSAAFLQYLSKREVIFKYKK
jgi:hypoxanthine phosphoribosyltransferase